MKYILSGILAGCMALSGSYGATPAAKAAIKDLRSLSNSVGYVAQCTATVQGLEFALSDIRPLLDGQNIQGIKAQSPVVRDSIEKIEKRLRELEYRIECYRERNIENHQSQASLLPKATSDLLTEDFLSLSERISNTIPLIK